MLGNLSVGHKLCLTPIIYTLILFGVLAYTVDNSQRLLLDSTVQDVAGRQRMLNELYLQQVFLERMGRDSEKERVAELFLNSQRGLKIGGQVTVNMLTGEKVTVPPAEDPQLQSILDEQRSLFEEQVRLADRFLSADETNEELVSELRDLSNRIFENCNALIKGVAENSTEKVSSMIRNVSIAALVVAALGFILSLAIARQITAPLQRILGVVNRVSGGDFREEEWESRIDGKDELARLSSSVADMKENLRALINEVVQATTSLTAAASQVAASSRQQSAATSEQMAAVQETTATMEELGQTGNQVSERAREVGATAESTSTASVSGVEAVQSTYRIMEQIRDQVQVTAENIVSLSEQNKAVREVISTVNDIAERTNLLALNAAIEASSAGESGTRFSVVADELKSLAEQAKSSTVEVRKILEDIEERIHRSVMLTEEAVKRVERGRREAGNAEETISELNSATVDSVRAFQQIVASTNQQQIGFEQVVQALQNIREASEQSNIGIRQLDEASSSLSALVEQLLTRTNQFKV